MSSNIREWLYRPGVCPPPLTPPLSPRSPPVSRQWFSSGSWQIDGIMNSDVLCKCGCTLLPSLALQTTQFQHQPTAVHVLSPPLPSPPHSTPLRPSSWSWRTDAGDEELLVWVWTPALLQTPQVTLLPPLLINPSPSHSGFDATNVGGLSRFCHQRGSKGGVRLWWRVRRRLWKNPCGCVFPLWHQRDDFLSSMGSMKASQQPEEVRSLTRWHLLLRPMTVNVQWSSAVETFFPGVKLLVLSTPSRRGRTEVETWQTEKRPPGEVVKCLRW